MRLCVISILVVAILLTIPGLTGHYDLALNQSILNGKRIIVLQDRLIVLCGNVSTLIIPGTEQVRFYSAHSIAGRLIITGSFMKHPALFITLGDGICDIRQGVSRIKTTTIVINSLNGTFTDVSLIDEGNLLLLGYMVREGLTKGIAVLLHTANNKYAVKEVFTTKGYYESIFLHLIHSKDGNICIYCIIRDIYRGYVPAILCTKPSTLTKFLLNTTSFTRSYHFTYINNTLSIYYLIGSDERDFLVLIIRKDNQVKCDTYVIDKVGIDRVSPTIMDDSSITYIIMGKHGKYLARISLHEGNLYLLRLNMSDVSIVRLKDSIYTVTFSGSLRHVKGYENVLKLNRLNCLSVNEHVRLINLSSIELYRYNLTFTVVSRKTKLMMGGIGEGTTLTTTTVKEVSSNKSGILPRPHRSYPYTPYITLILGIILVSIYVILRLKS